MFELTQDDRDHLEGRTVACSISGGKDSMAMALWLREVGVDATFVFADTGWESTKTDEYIRTMETVLGQTIHKVGFPGGMEALIKWKGMFPSRTRRFCTQFLKTKPLSEFMRDMPGEVVNCVGIRGEESTPRSLMLRWELPSGGHFSGIHVWRPILEWKFEDVVAIHRRHGIKPNPLYLEGFERVGCFPCIFERKEGIRRIAEDYPEQIETIRRWEEEMKVAAQAKFGDDLDASRIPTFFQKNSFRDGHPMGYELGLVDGGGMPIDAAVKWSESPRGQHPAQAQLFALSYQDEDVGCVRWGLCDHRAEAWPEDEDEAVEV